MTTEAAPPDDIREYIEALLGSQVIAVVVDDPDEVAELGESPWVLLDTDDDDTPVLPVFSSVEELEKVTDEDVECLVVPFAELVANWPDESWALMVDPASESSLFLPAENVAVLTEHVRTVMATLPEPEPAIEAELADSPGASSEESVRPEESASVEGPQSREDAGPAEADVVLVKDIVAGLSGKKE